MSQNTSNTLRKQQIVDDIILNDLTLHPDKPINQIGNDLKDLGVYESREAIYHRLVKSDYLRVEVTKLKERVRETWLRELMPLSIKRIKNALKNDDLDDKIRFPYIKLVADKVLGEDFAGMINTTINIKSLQAIIGKAMDR
jgi:hypothetical protein